MGAAQPRTKLSIDEFLAWDATQTDKVELVCGEIFAMAGAEDGHVTAAGNIYVALRHHLKGSPCRAYMSDMKLRVESLGSVFYPDVMVTCSASDHQSRLVKTEPILLVEVLSPSTAAYDRGNKFAQYRQLDALREYVLVDVESRRTDVYRKNADGLWVLHPFEPGQAVQLASVDLLLPDADLYAEVDPPETA